MDPRFRLQPGMPVNPSGPISLRQTPRFTPSLSSGQGFHTVESLQGVSTVSQDGMVGYAPLSGYDAAGGLGGRPVGVGQLGYDAAPAGVHQFAAHQAGMQRLVSASPPAVFPSFMQGGYSVPVEMAAATTVIPQGIPKQSPVYVYQPYIQPEISRAPVRYVARPPVVPEADAGLQMREYADMRLREDDRQQEREWKNVRMRERMAGCVHERRRNIERRREFDRDRELDRRRAFERRQEFDYDNHVRERFKGKVKGPIRKKLPQLPTFTARQYDYLDDFQSKVPPVYVQRQIRCALCQIECNSQEMLGQHLAGKKHQAKVKAEEDNKESKQVQTVEANKEEKLTGTENEVQQEGVNATSDTLKTNASKGKGKAKIKRDTIKKARLPVSNVDPSHAEVISLGVIDETAQDTDKVQAAAIQPATTEVEMEDAALVKDLGSGEGSLDTDVEGVIKESYLGVIKIEEGMTIITSVVSDNKAGGPELPNDATLVGGGKDHEAEPSTRKTWQLKTKNAGASPLVDAEAVRCVICKVTCRNSAVYATHLKGQKHEERARKGQVQTPSGKTAKGTNLVDADVADGRLPTPGPATAEDGTGINGQPIATLS